MSKFIRINNSMMNIDHIVRVEMYKDHKYNIKVVMTDSSATFTSDDVDEINALRRFLKENLEIKDEIEI